MFFSRLIMMLVVFLASSLHADFYVCWYMYSEELSYAEDIILRVMQGDTTRCLVELDKSDGDNLWLHNRNPYAFSTYVQLDKSDAVACTFQIEIL